VTLGDQFVRVNITSKALEATLHATYQALIAECR